MGHRFGETEAEPSGAVSFPVFVLIEAAPRVQHTAAKVAHTEVDAFIAEVAHRNIRRLVQVQVYGLLSDRGQQHHDSETSEDCDDCVKPPWAEHFRFRFDSDWLAGWLTS